ncbi:MAG: PAS domain S-box protein [Bacteroidota bacterium]|nr:PAS domain S-box protein [Bacteroidota bacterium]MDP3145497.1 PAS domain S-box protein [Bacteroidota bacterium]
MKKLSNNKILLVDDKNENLIALAAVLKKAGYQADSVLSGKEALTLLLKNNYGLLLLDVQMPEMNGIELAELIKGNSKTKDIPIIFLTANANHKEFVIKGHEVGALDYMTKPINEDLLVLKVKNILDLNKSKIELKEINKSLEKKAIQAQISYQDLYFSLSEEVFVLDKEGIVVSINRAGKLTCGLIADELLNKHFSKSIFLSKIFGENNLNKNFFSVFFKNGQASQRIEFNAVKNDGEIHYGEALITIAMISGKFHLQLSLFDITERKKSEKKQELNFKEIKYLGLINNSLIENGSLEELSRVFLNGLNEITKTKMSRVYSYNVTEHSLKTLIENLVPEFTNLLEKKFSTENLIILPKLNDNSILANLINSNSPLITSDKKEIINLFSDQNESAISIEIAKWTREYFDVNTFGVLPLFSRNSLLGLITFSSTNVLNEDEKNAIIRLSKQVATSFDKKSSELALAESENFNRGILSSLTSQIAVIDYNGNIISVNEAWRNFSLENGETNLTRTGIGGNYFEVCEKAIIAGDIYSDKALQGIKKVLSKEIDRFEMEYPCHSPEKDGWFILSVSGFDGDNQKAVIRHVDISERKKAEEKIKQSEAQYRGLFNKMNEGLLFSGEDGLIRAVNPFFCHMVGYADHELIGKNGYEIFCDDSIRMDTHKKIAQRKSGKSEQYELEFKTKSGNKILTQISASPTFSRDGDFDGVMSIVTDITERKKQQNELQKTVQELINRNNELMQFNYIVSHNLRAPIANVIGLANLLNTPDIEEEDKPKIIEYIQTATLKMDEQVKDLSMVLATRSALNTKKETVIFSELLEGISNTLSEQIQYSGINILTEIQSDAKEIYTVKSYIESIFYNLISNAIKYKSSLRKPKLFIVIKKQDDNFIIKVSDNGMGIDLTMHGTYVFGLYKRFNLEVEGKGLGLHMTKAQVEGLGGSISIESEPEKGTTFKIIFPK